MLNPNLTTDIRRAVNKHYDVLSTTGKVYLENIDHKEGEYFDIRVIGPYYQEENETFYVELDVDVLVTVDDINIYKMSDWCGIVSAIMTDIKVFNDVDVFQFCLKRTGEIKIDDVSRLSGVKQSTVKTSYRGVI